jgi:hypothetical protein
MTLHGKSEVPNRGRRNRNTRPISYSPQPILPDPPSRTFYLGIPKTPSHSDKLLDLQDHLDYVSKHLPEAEEDYHYIPQVKRNLDNAFSILEELGNSTKNQKSVYDSLKQQLDAITTKSSNYQTRCYGTSYRIIKND